MHLIHKDDSWITKLGIKLSKTGPWVAGGAALQWYLNRPTHDDIDLFFANEQQFNNFRKDLEGILRGYPEPTPFDQTWLNPPTAYQFDVHESENAISYHIRENLTLNELGKIQLIRRRFYPSPRACIEDFDISVAQIATDGNEYWFGDHTLADIAAKQFRFTKAIGPSTGRRFIKYHAYGFNAIESAHDELFNSDKVSWVRAVGQDDYA